MSNLQQCSYVDSYEMGHSIIDNNEACTYVKVTDDKKLKPWVCTITGIDPEYGFKRKFCESRVYSLKAPYQNWFKIVFKIEKGLVHEFRNFTVSFDEEINYRASGFFGANDYGIATLTKNDVRKALGMKVKEITEEEIKAWKKEPKVKKREPEQLGLMIDTKNCEYDKF
jgi:hypothetical protein